MSSATAHHLWLCSALSTGQHLQREAACCCAGQVQQTSYMLVYAMSCQVWTFRHNCPAHSSEEMQKPCLMTPPLPWHGTDIMYNKRWVATSEELLHALRCPLYRALLTLLRWHTFSCTAQIELLIGRGGVTCPCQPVYTGESRSCNQCINTSSLEVTGRHQRCCCRWLSKSCNTFFGRNFAAPTMCKVLQVHA